MIRLWWIAGEPTSGDLPSHGHCDCIIKLGWCLDAHINTVHWTHLTLHNHRQRNNHEDWDNGATANKDILSANTYLDHAWCPWDLSWPPVIRLKPQLVDGCPTLTLHPMPILHVKLTLRLMLTLHVKLTPHPTLTLTPWHALRAAMTLSRGLTCYW